MSLFCIFSVVDDWGNEVTNDSLPVISAALYRLELSVTVLGLGVFALSSHDCLSSSCSQASVCLALPAHQPLGALTSPRPKMTSDYLRTCCCVQMSRVRDMVLVLSMRDYTY